MAHTFALNRLPNSANHSFSQVWLLTRVLKRAGYIYKASSDGTTKDASATPNPFNDKWGSGGLTGNSGSAASIGTKTYDDLVVSGLSGMSANSVGNYITFTGAASGGNNFTCQVVEFISTGSVKIRNAAGVANDANNGAISWTERDPLLDTYPTALDSVACWSVYEGVKTVRIPVGSITGTFLRGEKITQAGSLAEGELLGVSLSTSGNQMVLVPRLGTFNNSGLITGAISTATVTPTGGTVLTYAGEVVFAKDTTIFVGWVLGQRCETTTEAAQRFSAIAIASATATVAPGNGSGGNALPTTGYMLRGTTNSTSVAFFNGIISVSSTMGMGLTHAVCANTIGSAGVSPDGTFWLCAGLPGDATSAASATGWGMFRMDDTETGDVDPFVWINVTGSSSTRTSALNSTSNTWSTLSTSDALFFGTTAMQGWRRRGYGTGDTFVQPVPVLQRPANGTSSILLTTNPSDPDRVASHPDQPLPREPLFAAVIAVGSRCRKGSFRWASAAPPVTSFYTLWENKTWLQVNIATTAGYPSLLLGPWDGSTTPKLVL